MSPRLRRFSTSPLAWAVAVAAFVAVSNLLLVPLHARGILQPVLAVCNALSRVLALPGLVATNFMGLQAGHRPTAVGWVVVTAVNLPLYAVAILLVRTLWRGGWSRREPATTRAARRRLAADEAAQTPSRRTFLAAGGRVALAGVAGVGAWGIAVERQRFEITRRRFAVRDLHPELTGLRVIQLTDLHHGPWTTVAQVRQVVDTTNALAPDLVLLTGDYVQSSIRYLDAAVGELARLRPRIGVLATLGNHDWWEGAPQVQSAFAAAGIPLIDNARRFVTPDRLLVPQSNDGLCIAGVGDLWEDDINYDAALGGVSPALPRLLLSHNPDVAEEKPFLRTGHRVDLMLSGHTHGGQIRIPGRGTPIVPSRYGQKYAMGLVQGPACPVYVSRGLGTAIMPVRLGVRPEIAVIELTRA